MKRMNLYARALCGHGSRQAAVRDCSESRCCHGMAGTLQPMTSASQAASSLDLVRIIPFTVGAKQWDFLTKNQDSLIG